LHYPLTVLKRLRNQLTSRLCYYYGARKIKNVWKNEDFNSAIGKQMKYKKKGIENVEVLNTFLFGCAYFRISLRKLMHVKSSHFN
jgi:hypothetical protein